MTAQSGHELQRKIYVISIGASGVKKIYLVGSLAVGVPAAVQPRSKKRCETPQAVQR
jgi:hypothetical protein